MLSSNQKECHQIAIFYFKYLKVVILRIWVNVLKVDRVFHLLLLKNHGLYIEDPATLPYRKACCHNSTYSDDKLRFCCSALLRTDVNASVLKAEEEL